MPVDDREIHALGLTLRELSLETLLRRRILREDHQARRILIDSVHHERASLAMRAEALLEDGVDRSDAGVPLERHGKHARGLVDHDQRLVFENDVEVARDPGARPLTGAPRPVHPDPDHISFREPQRAGAPVDFGAVQKYLAALDRGCSLGARSEPLRRGQEPVYPRTGIRRGRRPVHVVLVHAAIALRFTERVIHNVALSIAALVSIHAAAHSPAGSQNNPAIVAASDEPSIRNRTRISNSELSAT